MARGIKERTIVLTHVLKSSMLTIVTLLGLSLGSLLGGTAIVESIFMWPGVGKLAVDAISSERLSGHTGLCDLDGNHLCSN